MTSWFEQSQGESWESGETFESPFAAGGEAWNEVTEAPTSESWGGESGGTESWAEQWNQPSSEQWTGEQWTGEQSRGRRRTRARAANVTKSRHPRPLCLRPHGSRRRARGAMHRPAGRAEPDGHHRLSPRQGASHGQARSRVSRSRPSRSSAPVSRSRHTSRSSRSRRRWKVRRRGHRVTPSSTGRSGCARAPKATA